MASPVLSLELIRPATYSTDGGLQRPGDPRMDRVFTRNNPSTEALRGNREGTRRVSQKARGGVPRDQLRGAERRLMGPSTPPVFQDDKIQG
ncbi:MAG: hypothetical protein QXX41_01185 [Nitrososphaerota archaeon]